MIGNYLKHIRRGLLKNRIYSLLNITGLTIGLTCFAFIVLWVKDELSYDKFNRNYDRIYRLTGTAKTETGISESAVSSAPMAKALKDDYPEIENTVRLDMREEIVTHHGDERFCLQNKHIVVDVCRGRLYRYPHFADNSKLQGD